MFRIEHYKRCCYWRSHRPRHVSSGNNIRLYSCKKIRVHISCGQQNRRWCLFKGSRAWAIHQNRPSPWLKDRTTLTLQREDDEMVIFPRQDMKAYCQKRRYQTVLQSEKQEFTYPETTRISKSALARADCKPAAKPTVRSLLLQQTKIKLHSKL